MSCVCCVCVFLSGFIPPPLWNETPLKDGDSGESGQRAVPGQVDALTVQSEGLRWDVGVELLKIFFLWNSRGKISLCHPALLCLLLLAVPLPPPPPPPPISLPPPWAVNVNGCISLSLNFTYDFPGAKHSKQAPLSLSWNAPGDATHFRRVTRTRPCRAGSDVYHL